MFQFSYAAYWSLTKGLSKFKSSHFKQNLVAVSSEFYNNVINKQADDKPIAGTDLDFKNDDGRNLKFQQIKEV